MIRVRSLALAKSLKIINFMTMDFDYLYYVTSIKLKKVNDKNFKPVSHMILRISGGLSKNLFKPRAQQFSPYVISKVSSVIN